MPSVTTQALIKQGKCRLPQQSSVSVEFQTDAFCKEARTESERAQNEASSCKTNLRPVPKENPGALAGATGADKKAASFEPKHYRSLRTTSNRKTVGVFGRFIAPRHKQMSRLLGYSLTLGTLNGWQDFGRVAAVRLTANERAYIAAVLLATLDPATVEDISATAVGAAGDPMPTFLGGMDDARSWASWASRSDLKAYALACFEAMASNDQAAFYAHIGSIEVTA